MSMSPEKREYLKAWQKQDRAINPEKYRLKHRLWARNRRADPTKRAIENAKRRMWRKLNPEKAAARDRRFELLYHDKRLARARKWRKEHPKEHAARNRAWAIKNPTKVRGYEFKKKFGLTYTQVEQMLKDQDSKCAICGRILILDPVRHSKFKRNLPHVDHDHASGKNRALLCGWCNPAIGGLQDSPELLRKAADYIEHYRAV